MRVDADLIVPSRRALRAAEEANSRAGHENGGFLSEAHGFVPSQPPSLQLPKSHRVWDEVVSELPALWRTCSVREALDGLPRLSARDLPERDWWRASSLLGILAHSYVRSEAEPSDLPAAIATPWSELAGLMDRPKPYLSYNDLIVYNWRFRDPGSPDPMRVENLDLLLPTVGNQEERVFYLTQVEIIAQCTPLVGAVVRAQEAIAQRDREGLKRELLLMTERIRHVTEVSFQKIDPNPLSASHVDPVVWANTVAPFAVPISEGTAGPSGTNAPVFHLLDAFLGRTHHETVLGKEMVHLGPWFPPLQREFFASVAETPLPDFVASSGDPELAGLFETLFDAYAGRAGYLGTHRLKVYGYLELAFKVGRTVTITGFTGAFKERAWKEVDQELENTRRERYLDRPAHVHRARLAGREPVTPDGGGPVRRIVFDTSEAGLAYRPGDRCHVLATNGPELVERTLASLSACGDELVPLTDAWRSSLGGNGDSPPELPLREFLARAKLRPLLRPVGKALLGITASTALDEILEQRHEDQWELSEVLELLARDGYDTRRLWRSKLWHGEAIARIVPPEPYRAYSVSSAPNSELPTRVELTVGRLEYRSAGGRVDGVSRRGTASTFLTHEAEPEQLVPLRVERPVRFALPADDSRPVVMIAGGTGISPFRGFLEERTEAPGANWLYLGTRTRDELYYRDELERLVEAGRLELRVAFSREDAVARSEHGALEFEDARRSRLPELLESEPCSAELWRLLRPESAGGEGAHVYVCGRGAFAQGVMGSIASIAARHSDGDEDGRAFVRRLVAERRYLQDVFTTYAPHTAPGVLGDGLFDASEVVLHNDDEHGYWFVIDGNVYDVTEFRHLHPGGPKIIRENAGLDATREYRAVLHHERSAVDAMLAMYKIGAIRRLRLGSAWGLALLPGEGIVDVSLRDLFRNWVRYLYLVVEMENAFSNDFDYLSRPLTRDDDPAELTALKLQLAAGTHRRFLEGYFAGALGEDLERLFALTIGLCAPGERLALLSGELEALRGSAEATAVRAFSERSASLYSMLAGRETASADALDRGWRFCSLVKEHDRRFLTELKQTVRRGVRVFEEHEAATLELGAAELVDVLLEIPRVAREFCARLASAGAES